MKEKRVRGKGMESRNVFGEEVGGGVICNVTENICILAHLLKPVLWLT